MPAIIAVPRFAVPQTCRSSGARAIISISAWEDGAPPEFPPQLDVLRLNVSDIHCGEIWDEATVALCISKGMTEPAAKHIHSAITFGRMHLHEPIVLHCTAGVSRSPAMALAIIADRFGFGSEEAAAANLFQNSPQALPNPKILQLADEILERDGRLIAAVAKHLSAAPRDLSASPW